MKKILWVLIELKSSGCGYCPEVDAALFEQRKDAEKAFEARRQEIEGYVRKEYPGRFVVNQDPPGYDWCAMEDLPDCFSAYEKAGYYPAFEWSVRLEQKTVG